MGREIQHESRDPTPPPPVRIAQESSHDSGPILGFDESVTQNTSLYVKCGSTAGASISCRRHVFTIFFTSDNHERDSRHSHSLGRSLAVNHHRATTRVIARYEKSSRASTQVISRCGKRGRACTRVITRFGKKCRAATQDITRSGKIKRSTAQVITR